MNYLNARKIGINITDNKTFARVCECCLKMVEIYVLIKYFMSTRKKNRIRVKIYIYFLISDIQSHFFYHAFLLNPAVFFFFLANLFTYIRKILSFSQAQYCNITKIFIHIPCSLFEHNIKVILQCYHSTFQHRKIQKTKGIYHETFSFYIAYACTYFSHTIFSCIFSSK